MSFFVTKTSQGLYIRQDKKSSFISIQVDIDKEMVVNEYQLKGRKPSKVPGTGASTLTELSAYSWVPLSPPPEPAAQDSMSTLLGEHNFQLYSKTYPHPYR